MKYKYILYGAVAISALAIANIYLWQKDVEDREINETAEIKEVSGKTEQKSLSDDFEYPAPVKQLQQVLTHSYSEDSREKDLGIEASLSELDFDNEDYSQSSEIIELQQQLNNLKQRVAEK